MKFNKRDWEITINGDHIKLKRYDQPLYISGIVEKDNITYNYAPPEYVRKFVAKMVHVAKWKFDVQGNEISLKSPTGEKYKGTYIPKLDFISFDFSVNIPPTVKNYVKTILQQPKENK